MDSGIVIALIVAFSTIINTLLNILINKNINKVKHATNSMKDQLINNALIAGEQIGKDKQIIKEEKEKTICPVCNEKVIKKQTDI
jgi:Na+-translocating ferredoxin:NAD+ oxidoreductase RnfG subunit